MKLKTKTSYKQNIIFNKANYLLMVVIVFEPNKKLLCVMFMTELVLNLLCVVWLARGARQTGRGSADAGSP